MVFCWFWVLRNPAFALAAVFLAAGVTGVLPAGLSLMATALLVIVADVSHHFGHRARRRRDRRVAVVDTLAQARELRTRHGRTRGQRPAA